VQSTLFGGTISQEQLLTNMASRQEALRRAEAPVVAVHSSQSDVSFSSRHTSQGTTGPLDAFVAARNPKAPPPSALNGAPAQSISAELAALPSRRQSTLRFPSASSTKANAIPQRVRPEEVNLAAAPDVKPTETFILGHAIRSGGYDSEHSYDSVLDGSGIAVDSEDDDVEDPSSQLDAAEQDTMSLPSTACRFCGDSESFEQDPLLQCAGCGVVVHAGCYGVTPTSIQAACERVQRGELRYQVVAKFIEVQSKVSDAEGSPSEDPVARSVRLASSACLGPVTSQSSDSPLSVTDGCHWLCEPCSLGLDTHSITCCMCPVKGGPLKIVDQAELPVLQRFLSMKHARRGQKKKKKTITPTAVTTASSSSRVEVAQPGDDDDDDDDEEDEAAAPAEPTTSTSDPPPVSDAPVTFRVPASTSIPKGGFPAPFPLGCGPPPPPSQSVWDSLSQRGRWVHITCGMFVPEVTVEDPTTFIPFTGFSRVPTDRWRYACKVCRSADGAVIQCSHVSCGVAFHAQCARDAGIQMLFRWEDDGRTGSFVMRCPRHDSRPEGQQAVLGETARRRAREARARLKLRRRVFKIREFARLVRARATIRSQRRERRLKVRATSLVQQEREQRRSERRKRRAMARRSIRLIKQTKSRHIALLRLVAKSRDAEWATRYRSSVFNAAEDETASVSEEEESDDGLGEGEVDSDVDDAGEWDGETPLNLNSTEAKFDWGCVSVANGRTVEQCWPQLASWFTSVGPATLRTIILNKLGRSFVPAEPLPPPRALLRALDRDADGPIDALDGSPIDQHSTDQVASITKPLRLFAQVEASLFALGDSLPADHGTVSIDHHSNAVSLRNSVVCPPALRHRDAAWYASVGPDGTAFGEGGGVARTGGERDARLSDQYRHGAGLFPFFRASDVPYPAWSVRDNVWPTLPDSDDLSQLLLPRASFSPEAPCNDVPELGRWYRELWADEDVKASLTAPAMSDGVMTSGRTRRGVSRSTSDGGASDPSPSPTAASEPSFEAPNATDFFAGFANGEAFNPLRKAYTPGMTANPPVAAFVDSAHRRNVCPNTEFRFGDPADAIQLARINRVNPLYATPEAFIHTLGMKNEFVVVAERLGPPSSIQDPSFVDLHSSRLRSLTGFVSYYFMWFRVVPDDVSKAVANLNAASLPTNTLTTTSTRTPPEPVMYLATLQAVKRSTHTDILPPSADVMTSTPPHRSGTPPSSSPLHRKPVPENGPTLDQFPSVPVSDTDGKPLVEEAEPKTGTLLLLLACRHAASQGIRWVLVDSTEEAVSFYVDNVGFEARAPTTPIPPSKYVPLRLFLPALDPYAVLGVENVGGSPLRRLAASAAAVGVGCLNGVPRSVAGYHRFDAAEWRSTGQGKKLLELFEGEGEVVGRLGLDESSVGEAFVASANAFPIEDELTEALADCRGRLTVAAACSDVLLSKLLLRVHQREMLAVSLEDSRRSDMSVWSSWQRGVEQVRREREEAQRRAEEDDNATCGVCGGGRSHPRNQIIFCDSCNAAVHQQCVGLAIVPEEQWFCDTCAAAIGSDTLPESVSPPRHNHTPRDIACALCPVRGGALKPTDTAEGRRMWVHMLCARVLSHASHLQASLAPMAGPSGVSPRWIPPHVSFRDPKLLRPVRGLLMPSTDTNGTGWLPFMAGNGTCDLCGMRHGVVVPCCNAQSCGGRVHVTCAFQRGLVLIRWSEQSVTSDPEDLAYALGLSTVLPHVMKIEGNSGASATEQDVGEDPVARERRGVLGAAVRASFSRGGAGTSLTADLPPVLVHCPRCAPARRVARDLTPSARMLFEAETKVMKKRRSDVSPEALLPPAVWRRQKASGGGQDSLWDPSWVEYVPDIAEAEGIGLRAQVYSSSGFLRDSVDVELEKVIDKGCHSGGVAKLLDQCQGIEDVTRRRAIADASGIALVTVWDTFRHMLRQFPSTGSGISLGVVESWLESVMSRVLKRAESLFSGEGDEPRHVPEAELASLRQTVRETTHHEALELLRALLKEASASSSSQHVVELLRAQHLQVAEAAPKRDVTQLRSLSRAIEHGSGSLFPYAAGHKLSVAAVERGTLLVLPYGENPMGLERSGGDVMVRDLQTGEVVTQEDDSGNEPICICHRTWAQDSSFALCCSKCERWFHAACLGLDVVSETQVRRVSTGELIDVEGDWMCPGCIGEETSRKRPRSPVKSEDSSAKRPKSGSLKDYFKAT
jgi:hypothetical protein